mgnify:CR=1 FL=1
MSDLDNIISSFKEKISSIKSKDELQNLKTEFFGKNGQITNQFKNLGIITADKSCLLYTSPSPRDGLLSRMPSSA